MVIIMIMMIMGIMVISIILGIMVIIVILVIMVSVYTLVPTLRSGWVFALRSELQATFILSALSERRKVSCFESLSLIFTTLSPPRSCRHLVNMRNGRTRTMNMGMKATTRTMTTTRAMRAATRARGKRITVTKAPQ